VSRVSSNLGLNHELGLDHLQMSPKFVGRSSLGYIACLDLLADDIRCTCLIKIDADGAEAEILAGASRIQAMPDVRWLIETYFEKLERTLHQVAARRRIQNRDYQKRLVPCNSTGRASNRS
jgi:hypothetical protein